MVDLALGRPPDFLHRQGAFRIAAKFMVRVFDNGVLCRMPGSEDVARLQRLFPEARIHPVAREGMRLHHLPYQDSYSFELADIFLGGDRKQELLEKYERCMQILPFELEPEQAA